MDRYYASLILSKDIPVGIPFLEWSGTDRKSENVIITLIKIYSKRKAIKYKYKNERDY